MLMKRKPKSQANTKIYLLGMTGAITKPHLRMVDHFLKCFRKRPAIASHNGVIEIGTFMDRHAARPWPTITMTIKPHLHIASRIDFQIPGIATMKCDLTPLEDIEYVLRKIIWL